jgi:hypothetical protein
MPLKIIGAGWGRTGTTSMKHALGLLGYACHDMEDLFRDWKQADLFLEASHDPSFDWERIFGSYDATVDFPGCLFWRELAAFYPEAKVVLTVRPSADYYASYVATIRDPMVDPDAYPAWNAMVREVIVPRAFDGDPGDRDVVISSFERHNAAVQAAIPGDRHLVYNVSEGWPPLCEFLGQPAPAVPFPNRNRREDWDQGRPRAVRQRISRAARRTTGTWRHGGRILAGSSGRRSVGDPARSIGELRQPRLAGVPSSRQTD